MHPAAFPERTSSGCRTSRTCLSAGPGSRGTVIEVVTAGDGPQAVVEHAARLGQLRCVVLDYSMPKLTGDRVLAELRRVDAEVPVIVMSGFSDQGVEGPFAGLGVSSFLQRPFRLAELRNRLRRALEG